VCVGIVVLLLFQAAPNAAPLPAADELRRGKTSFDRGEYARAIEILRPLLYPEIRLESEGQIVQAHRMLGVAELFQGHNDAAAQEFRSLLQLRPDYRFDPLLDPPQVVDLFNGVLRAHEAEVETLEARQREEVLARQRDRSVAISWDRLFRQQPFPTWDSYRPYRRAFGQPSQQFPFHRSVVCRHH